MNCGGFLFWAKEDEVIGDLKTSQNNPVASSEGREFMVGDVCHGNEVIIELKDHMIGIA